MVHVIAMEVLPEERDRKYYADSYSCCPPPLFILLITIIEVRIVSIYLFVQIFKIIFNFDRYELELLNLHSEFMWYFLCVASKRMTLIAFD